MLPVSVIPAFLGETLWARTMELLNLTGNFSFVFKLMQGIAALYDCIHFRYVD